MLPPHHPSSLLAWLCLTAALGCFSASSELDGNLTSDAGGGKDASTRDSSSPDLDGGAPRAVPTTITLANAGTVPIVVGDECGGRFLSLEHQAQPVSYDRSCACACDQAQACGCPAVCLFTQELVVPGRSVSFEWDGLYARYDELSCYELAGFDKDDRLVAKGCYLENESVACDSTEFAYDSEREVTIRATPEEAQPSSMSVVLDNETGGDIRIVTDGCGSPQWFVLDLPDSTLSSFCPCSCDAEFELGLCPICGACAEDVIETIAHGASYSFTWDGRFFHHYESGCSARYDMPVGFVVQAKACFTRAGETQATCTSARFTHGLGDEVRFVAQ